MSFAGLAWKRQGSPVLMRMFRGSFLTSAFLVLSGLAYLPVAEAGLEDQILDSDNNCGGAFTNFSNCTAGEISISSVVNTTFVGNPVNCVIGQPLTIQSATVNYDINTQTRYDLLMWIGNQQGTDPRNDYTADATRSCTTISLPSPFAAIPGPANPFGNMETPANADGCADINGAGVTQASRIFSNVPVSCQDNNNNGKADLNVLLSWSQNQNQACGTGPGESFPTAGAGSKCDYDTIDTDLDIVLPPVLTLVKQVTNNSGGSQPASAWNLTATGPTNLSGATGTPAVTAVTVQAGAYTLGETGPAGYTGTWNCTGGGTFTPPNSLTLAAAFPAQNVTCTLTNDDNPATLTLVKNLVNNNGGTSTLANWTLTATGASATVTGTGDSMSIVNQSVPAGSYTLTESGPGGYTASAWSCPGFTLTGANSNVLALGLGQSATCTITNDDQPANLTLTKSVVNNNGGNAVPGDWTLTANAISFTSGVQQPISAGTYTLAESGGPGGYQAGAWQCSGGSFVAPDQLTLANGQTASCAIINTDVAPTLTLVKDVTNSTGGNDPAGSFALRIAGGTFGGGQDFSDGAMPTVVSNTNYTLSETPNTGYTLTNIACVDDDTQQTVAQGQSPQISLNEGQNVTCTFFNEDIAPQLTLVKSVESGDADPSDFTLTLQGNDGTHGSPQNYPSGQVLSVFSNVVYSVSELPDPDYLNLGTTCVDDDTGGPVSHPVTLAEGQQVTCTVANEEIIRGSLTVIKVVDNDNGGTDVAADFTLRITGDDGAAGNCGQDGSAAFASGDSITPQDGCTYTISEDSRPGYTQVGDTVCVDSSNGNANAGHPVTFTSGQTLVCTITNTDDGALLALIKLVTNNNGGTAAEEDWTLIANGPTPQQGAGGFIPTTVNAGVYTLSETGGPPGYTPSAWDCASNNDKLSGNQLTLSNGDNVICAITNDDQPASLTLTKIVINNDGGSEMASAWTLSAGMIDFTSGQTQDVDAGTYTLSESGPSGYTAGVWQCEGGSLNGDQLTLANGQSAACVITNDDNPPSLTLVKEVINDNGGLAVPGSFTLTLQGDDGVHGGAGVNYSSGAMPPVVAGVAYTMTETPLDGYEPSGPVCIDTSNGNAEVPHPVTLSVGQDVTCTITNDDIAPTLLLTKEVINDNNGELGPEAFSIILTGDDGTHLPGIPYPSGATPTILANVSYTVTEQEQEGYELVDIVCTDTDTQQELSIPFTPARAQNIACVVTNDDKVEDIARFRVQKDFTDDNPGEVEVFIDCNTGLILDQDKTISEARDVVFVVTSYDVGELNCSIFEEPVPAGYSEEYFAAEDTPDGGVAGAIYDDAEGCHFEQVEGGDFICTIVNQLDEVEVEVQKIWIGDFEANGFNRTASAEWTCYNVRANAFDPTGTDSGGLSFSGDSTDFIGVYPDWDGSSYCTVAEVGVESAIEPDASDCSNVPVIVGAEAPICTIYNVLFLEGIPTLNQYGLALMALLMLGLGFVGFRRFI